MDKSLTVVAKETETAKNVFAVFNARERFRRETNLPRLQRSLLEDGKKVIEDEFITLFRKLQDLGIGTLVNGRGNRPTRFKWHYNLRDVAKAAHSNKALSNKSKIGAVPEKPTTIEAKEVSGPVIPNNITSIILTPSQFETLMRKLMQQTKEGGDL